MPNYRLIQRKDTEANWSAVVPAEGEIAFVDSGANAGRFKIGDGTTTYAGLDYAAPETPNPTGGQDNFLPIAGPTATGTAEAETLAVTSSAGLAVDDPANVVATITADQFQEGSLLTVKSDAGDSLLDIDNIGNAVVGPGHVTIGDPLAARIEIGPASGSQDGTIKAVNANNQDVFSIIPENIGSSLAALLLNSSSSSVFEALGDGRVLKTGTQVGSEDLLSRSELDARFSGGTNSWIPTVGNGPGTNAVYGQVKVFAGGPDPKPRFFDLGNSGTWVFFVFTHSSDNDREFVKFVMTGTGTQTVFVVDQNGNSIPFDQAIAFCIDPEPVFPQP